MSSLTIFKVSKDLRHSEQRGRLVATIVQEQFRAILEGPSVYENRLLSDRLWPDEYIPLKGWLITEFVRVAQPGLVEDKLTSMMRRQTFSVSMEASLFRWKRALDRWSQLQKEVPELSIPDLLDGARAQHAQAAGYAKIGRSYDATAYYLWSADFLRRFIHQAPYDQKVPEALYLLGDAYLHFRNALPQNVRSDRILNLVSEFYPETIWAKKADNLWRREMRNEI